MIYDTELCKRIEQKTAISIFVFYLSTKHVFCDLNCLSEFTLDAKCDKAADCLHRSAEWLKENCQELVKSTGLKCYECRICPVVFLVPE